MKARPEKNSDAAVVWSRLSCKTTRKARQQRQSKAPATRCLDEDATKPVAATCPVSHRAASLTTDAATSGCGFSLKTASRCPTASPVGRFVLLCRCAYHSTSNPTRKRPRGRSRVHSVVLQRNADTRSVEDFATNELVTDSTLPFV